MIDQSRKVSSADAYYVHRVEQIKQRIVEGKETYPHKFVVKNEIEEILKDYKYLGKDEGSEDVVQMAGRIMVVRDCKRIAFYKIVSGEASIQAVICIGNEKDKHKEEYVKLLKRGDIVGIRGNPKRTKTGELSVFVDEIILLAPCLRTLPVEHFGIKDPEIIYRKRYLDLLLNGESRMRFITRSKIIQYIRKFLDERGFLEVETPMMNHIPGGAAAKPFKTYHNELKADLYMRISPELFLKMLVVGGMNKVYELGKEYRNEGIDLTHNPEFTSCEFYMAYADYEDMMRLTEELLRGMVLEINKTDKVRYCPAKREEKVDEVIVDFKTPFRRVNMLEELGRKIGMDLNGDNLESPKILEELIRTCEREGIAVGEPKTLSRVLDKLVGKYIEPECINPTFLIGHPLVMSPLAKKHRECPGLTERFELIVNGKEICNAYTELNDPFDQKERFEQQVLDQKAGDEEAMMMDKGFCTALEYGLPPTGGWGMGIDRLVMLLTNAANIRDVIFFPAMKSESEDTSGRVDDDF
jgi:lysyl-tRNA synthetase class 2